MCKKDFYEYLNFGKTTEASLWASAYIIADKFDIPLIIQGENAGLTLGVRKLGVGTDYDALKVFDLDTLKSGWERYIGDGICAEDLFMFHFDLDSIKKLAVVFELIYLTGRIEMTLPGTFTFRVRPAGSADINIAIITHYL